MSYWLSLAGMGKVVVKVKLTNYIEEQLKKLKLLKGKPHSMETEVLVDTGATRLYLQSSVIRGLGLRKEGEGVSRTSNGSRKRAVYQAARLELMGRNGAFQVVEVDDNVPNLLGQIPLEYLDRSWTPRAKNSSPIRNTARNR